MKRILCIISLIGLVIACNDIKNQNNNIFSHNQESTKEVYCEEIIYKIVQSSNLDLSLYPKYFVRIDRIENNIIFIQVYFENNISETNDTKQIVESTIAWLSLEVKEKKLYNITFDIENPIVLSFDEKLLNADNIERICMKSNEEKIISESESSNHIRIKKNLVDKKYKGKWECFKYIKDIENDAETEIFSEKYAEQFSHFAQFSLKKDSLLIPKGCSKYVFQYKYSTKLKRDNEEDSYIIFLKPKQDSISFIKGIEDDLECNDIFNRLYLNDTTIIFRDRGYFFYFKKKYKDDFTSKDFHIEGIPGDDRNYWKVEREYNFSDFQDAYNCFLIDFSYGSENLLKKIPLKSFYDNKHYINYTIQKNNIIIEKEVPLGIVSIRLRKKNNICVLSYEIKYPEE